MPKNERSDPAFPVPGGLFHERELGMSRRDYFAAKAMAAMIQKSGVPNTEDARKSFGPEAYMCADLVLGAR